MPRAKSVKKTRKVTKPVGKPRLKITEYMCKRAEKLAAQGLTMEQIASVLNMGIRTLYEKKTQYKQFAQAIERGRDKGIQKVTNALFKKAVKGDVPAQKYFLNNKDKDNWRDRTENTFQGPGGGAIEVSGISDLSDAQLDARIKKLMNDA